VSTNTGASVALSGTFNLERNTRAPHEPSHNEKCRRANTQADDGERLDPTSVEDTADETVI